MKENFLKPLLFIFLLLEVVMAANLFAQSELRMHGMITSVNGNRITIDKGLKDGVANNFTGIVYMFDEYKGKLKALPIAKFIVVKSDESISTGEITKMPQYYRIIPGSFAVRFDQSLKIPKPEQDTDRKKKLSPGMIYINPKDGSEMSYIPEGNFTMGNNRSSNDEKPEHKVYTDDFYIDRYEVTNGRYKKYLASVNSAKKPKYWDDLSFNAEKLPVVGINWKEALDYCKWAGGRLPTEAEWEKAARGGLSGKQYPQGDEVFIRKDKPYFNSSELGVIENKRFDQKEKKEVIDWFSTADGFKYSAPVGQFPANKYNLCDMAGNVLEWVMDWHSKIYYIKSKSKNPTGPDSGEYKVGRGGSWFFAAPSQIVTKRYIIDPEYRLTYLGFRCVLEINK